MLSSIRKGAFSDTPPGQYLLSIKEQFQPDTVLDMYCYISLFLELSLTAKGRLMMNEAGIPPKPLTEEQKQDIRSKVQELKQLKRNIGPTGVIALKPIIGQTNVDEWLVNEVN